MLHLAFKHVLPRGICASLSEKISDPFRLARFAGKIRAEVDNGSNFAAHFVIGTVSN